MNNIAIFISGNGTTLKRIIESCNSGEISAKVKLVISSNENCNGVKIARDENITVFSTNNSEKIVKALEDNDIDFIVLAGYLKLLPKEIVNKYPKKIINVHPSLLPDFGGPGMYGIHVHEAVIASNQKRSGATVHYVSENFDDGEIIDQCVVGIDPLETPESLQEKIKVKEKELLIGVLKRLNH